MSFLKFRKAKKLQKNPTPFGNGFILHYTQVSSKIAFAKFLSKAIRKEKFADFIFPLIAAQRKFKAKLQTFLPCVDFASSITFQQKKKFKILEQHLLKKSLKNVHTKFQFGTLHSETKNKL